MTVDLKKAVRAADLGLAACRKRQSPRTGFVHAFAGDEAASDTIPLYENFCFALALFRQKTAESVLEGKELLERLLAFQTIAGSFPVYLHDYPRCWDFLMPLKVAPILILLLRHFGSVLGAGTKEKVERALQGLLAAAEASRAEKRHSPLWENRFLACKGEMLGPIEASALSPAEWCDWVLTAQIAGEMGPFSVPYHPEMEAFLDGGIEQERGEPKPFAIEWALAESQGGVFSPRLLRDHLQQIHAAPLFPFEAVPIFDASPVAISSHFQGMFRALWKGTSLHSLAAFHASRIAVENDRVDLEYELREEMKAGKEDLFEAAVFVDVSPETSLFIEGKKGTLFRLGEKIQAISSGVKFEIVFSLLEGGGDFCGHIYRSNRPNQTACKGPSLYEAYDWKIGLRTLRRSATAKIGITISSQFLCK